MSEIKLYPEDDGSHKLKYEYSPSPARSEPSTCTCSVIHYVPCSCYCHRNEALEEKDELIKELTEALEVEHTSYWEKVDEQRDDSYDHTQYPCNCCALLARAKQEGK